MIGESSNATIDYGTCRWCGCIHSGVCPRVEEIDYYENGAVKRVRFRSDDGPPLTVSPEPSPTIGPVWPPNTCTVTGMPDGVEVSYTA